MKLWEALKLVDEGKKVRKCDWYDGFYIYKNSRKYISHSKNDEVSIDIASYNLDADEWEEYDNRKEIPNKLNWLKEGFKLLSEDDYCTKQRCDDCPLNRAASKYSQFNCSSLYTHLTDLNNRYKLNK